MVGLMMKMSKMQLVRSSRSKKLLATCLRLSRMWRSVMGTITRLSSGSTAEAAKIHESDFQSSVSCLYLTPGEPSQDHSSKFRMNAKPYDQDLSDGGLVQSSWT